MKNSTYRFPSYICALILGWVLLFSPPTAQAQDLQAIPPLTALVIDQTNTLSSDEVAQLDAKLKAFEKTKGSQIGVLIVPTTAPEDIFSYTQRAAETYKLGRKGVGDGVLIVVAKNDHKIHLYVMRALEGAIPDAYAKRIINEQMQPAFRQGQFAAGLDTATTQIENLINGEQLPPPIEQQTQQSQQPQQGDASSIWIVLIFMSFVFAGFASGIAQVVGRRLTAPVASIIAGFVAFNMSSLIFGAIVAALIVGIFVLFFGKYYAQLATQRSYTNSTRQRNTDIFWGGGFGGFGGGSGGGGFGGGGWGGSGGGGDAGGGGASGGW